MSEERYLFMDEEVRGPYGFRELMRMREKGEASADTLFFSERDQQWAPLRGLANDFPECQTPLERIAQLKETGFKAARLSGPGQPVCAACAAIEERDYPIDAVPELPPADCDCVPWCRICVGCA